MGVARAEQAEVIAGSPAACFDALTEFETYPDWQSAVRDVDVRERDAQGRGHVVAFTIDAKVRSVRYVLRYHFEPHERIWWDYVEGDLRSVEGDFRFEDLGDGTTRAVYRLGIDPGVFVPGPLRKMLTGGVMRTVVRELRDRVEGS